NLETVERLQQPIRKSATYERTLSVLVHAASRGFTTKSGIMLGIGEREDEIGQAIRDLSKAGVQILTIGQYLQPTPSHAPIDRWAPPEEFEAWKEFALSQGICVVESGPLVRSSYHAEEQSERFGIVEAAAVSA
ncbi:MAG: lipoyl synthase, partial [Opitutales bacterium]